MDRYLSQVPMKSEADYRATAVACTLISLKIRRARKECLNYQNLKIHFRGTSEKSIRVSILIIIIIIIIILIIIATYNLYSMSLSFDQNCFQDLARAVTILISTYLHSTYIQPLFLPWQIKNQYSTDVHWVNENRKPVSVFGCLPCQFHSSPFLPSFLNLIVTSLGLLLL